MRERIAGDPQRCAIDKVPCAFLGLEPPRCALYAKAVAEVQECDIGPVLNRSGVKQIVDRHTDPMLHESNRLNARMLARKEILELLQSTQDREEQTHQRIRFNMGLRDRGQPYDRSTGEHHG